MSLSGRAFTVAAVAIATLLGCSSKPTRKAKDRPTGEMWPLEVTKQAFEDAEQVGYLAGLLNLLDREAEARASEKTTALYLDILGGHLALVGEHARALAAGDEAYGAAMRRASPPAGPDPLEGVRPVAALDAIVSAARNRRLVMVNEEHRSSMQRAFSNRLLVPLRGLGFRYIAVETVVEDAKTLNARGYPVLATGPYTRDPAFGDLIRRAIKLGYAIVPYEADAAESRPRPDDRSFVDAVNRRESAQARNIWERTFKMDAGAKVLVIAGRDHIAEAAGRQWIPMGGVLKELSGIDPLTINQTVMVEHSKPEFEHWAFTRAVEAGWMDEGPVVLVNDAGALWSASPGALDVSLFHPRTRTEHGRPNWMSMGGLRKPVRFEALQSDDPVLLQAHLAGEARDAVPVDQVILWPGRPRPQLMLRPGRYVLRLLDREGTELQRKETAVD